jgi:pimeloyl-ACP methyl ester carboxylesterase
MRPTTQYAKCGDLSIAYQVTGKGPLDLVYVPGWVSNLDYEWEFPGYARAFERLSSFARLIRFDKRGTGLSDREGGFPTLEQRIEDVQAVMEAVGSKRAALFGTSEGGNMSTLFAATYPERTEALVLYGCFAKRLWAPDYPWAATREELDRELTAISEQWGGPFDLQNAAPSLALDEEAREWFAAYLRYSASPKAAISIWDWNAELDVRNILPAIHVPTLVLHRRGDRWQKVEDGRYLAEHIPGAKYVELPGDDHVIWSGDQAQLLDEIEEFLTGIRPPPPSERVFLTVLFTDIAGSTSIATEIGDHRWKELLQRHDNEVRKELRRHRGIEVKTTGDGFLAAFDGPTRAIQCATAIRERIAQIGLDVRVAIHTGECEKRGEDLSGISVHLASRMLDQAQPGEILLSRTVKDLVVGSDIALERRGVATLRDVPGSWELFCVRPETL